VRVSSHSAAAPTRPHDAAGHPATNPLAPVEAGPRAAVESEETRGRGSAGRAQAGERAARAVVSAGHVEHAATGPAQPPPGDPASTILHVDIDAFFASIEQLRDPRLRGRPVIVGAGCIASCSYEARRFGLHAGMALSEARRLCPDAVILDGHAQTYRCFAESIFACCREVAPAVETYLDEAYCDLTGTERLHRDFTAAATRLKRRVREETGLAVTCGIGPNRMLAKLIGKTVKPDGLARIEAGEADAFLTDRPIEQLAGVGHAHARTLRSMNIRTIGELRPLPAETLAALFGAPGRMLYERCRGRDTAVVTEREIPRSISRETSFHRNTADRAEIDGMLEYLVGRACRAARELDIQPRTIAVRLRYADSEGDERTRSMPTPSATDPVVLEVALDVLHRLFTRRVALHLVGVTLSSFASHLAEQGSLFDEVEAGRTNALYRAFDGVRDSYGHGALVSGRALHLKGRLDEDRHGFMLRTSSLTK
jgi:DNA polymerase-4